MSIRPVSFGTQLKYKKNYEVQKRDGTPVSKDYADKIVKRNMWTFNIVGFPILWGGGLSLFTSNTKRLKSIWAMTATLAVIGIPLGYCMYEISKETKDYAPQSFYKWGGFKVVEKDK